MRRIVGVGSIALVMVAGSLLAVRLFRDNAPSGPACQATVGTSTYPFDAEQGANATTVAAVGKRLGMPDHAVTVALAAALQESRLHNLAGGDLDSRGLFQQRPSQGWGTTEQIMSPGYAAAAFYRKLATVPAWTTLAVTDAAQAVQRSAAPDAYAQWEPAARVLAQALTGEVAAGFTCRATVHGATTGATTLEVAMAAELGASDGGPVTPSRGWLVAGWLIGHARQFGVSSVTFGGRRWSASGGVWTAHPPPSAAVEINAT